MILEAIKLVGSYFKVFVFLLILILASSLAFTCNRLKKERAEVSRLTENTKQKLYADSLRFSSETLKLSEFKQYLEVENTALKKLLEAEQIKPKKVERIITTKTEYIVKDTSTVNLDSIKQAILNDLTINQPFALTDSCSTIKGFVSYNNSNLDLNITEKEFNNQLDIILHKQRKQWKFWFIKSRFLGKREITAKVIDQCGQSKTKEIIVQ